MKLGRDGEGLAVQSANDIETTVAGRRGIVGVPFQFRADFEEITALERTARQLVQSMEDSKPDGHTAAEATGFWNFAGDGAGEGEGAEGSAFKKMPRGRARHGPQMRSSPARDGHVVIKTESDPEAIEAGAEVGCARRNA